MFNDPRGSLWNKWDLHVHTPLSIKQEYGGDQEEVWEKYVSQLEALPPEFNVLGINDYLFVDGYERLLSYRSQGRLGNIALLLPVIELRVDKFSGSGSKLNRVNYHVIFSHEVTPDQIRTQFFGAIASKYKLSHRYASLQNQWGGVVTRDNLMELGQMIREETPASKRKNLPSSPLKIGFNNLNFSLDSIQAALESYQGFRGKYLTALGGAEWGQIRWDASAAEKKSIINGVDFVFLAASDRLHAERAVKKLIEQEVNHRLLDGSDAHHFQESTEKDRIGNCITWIKADPTFEGLRLAAMRYNDRVYLGDEPEKIKRVRSSSTKYIRGVKIKRCDDSDIDEHWFSDSLEFNHDLIAIIGNKGNGKSALTDILALCGRTRTKDFSFLNKHKFLNRDKKANHFEAKLTWESGNEVTYRLSDRVQDHEVEQIRYVPQSFFEIVTNEVAVREGGDFDIELKKVVFSHIPESERLGFERLSDLLDHHTSEVHSDIEHARRQLSDVNQRIEKFEVDTSEGKRNEVQGQIDTKLRELEAHEKTKPQPIEKPEGQSEQAAKLEELNAQIDGLKEQVNGIRARLAYLKKQKSTLAKVKTSLVSTYQRLNQFLQDKEGELQEAGVELDLQTVLKVELEIEPLEKIIQENAGVISRTEHQLDLDRADTFAAQLRDCEQKAKKLRAELNSIDKGREEYLRLLQEWQEGKAAIVGEPSAVGTLRFYEQRKKWQLEKYPQELAEQREKRREIVKGIFGKLSQLEQVYRKLAEPVQNCISNHPLTKEKYGLTFEVLFESVGFSEGFLGLIDQGRAGSFHGKKDGDEVVAAILEKHTFETEEDVLAFIDEVFDHLHRNHRLTPPKEGSVKNQLRKKADLNGLYDFVYGLSYLRPSYSLQLDGKELRQLSPGERGVLLLIFYLLIDNDDCPLIIDQPEENLDNQSVYELLVPGVSEAKRRRQIFLVTHNPNLAVVCDADQIIHCSIDKKDGCRVKYDSGAIENPKFNKYALDILEGGFKPFDVRRRTYLQNP